MDIKSIIEKIPQFQKKEEIKKTQLEYDQLSESLILAVANFFQHSYNKEFIIDSDNEKQILALAYYFTGNPRFEFKETKTDERVMDYSLRKGLFLIGNYGCGKSSLIYSFCEVLRNVGQGFLRYSMIDIDDDFAQNSYSAFNKHRGEYPKYYDDIGRESVMAGSYGNKASVATKICEFRYRLFIEKGVKTHYSSNMNGKTFEERYSDFIYTRIKESCNIINFKSNTKNRRLQPQNVEE